MNLSGKSWKYTVAACRIFLGLIFFAGGMSKLPVPGIMGPVWLEQELTKYELGMFARFIAYVQVFTGALLLTKRFATVGAIMLFPMLVNILVITISMHWRGTPFVIAFFIMQNLVLLADDYPRLKSLITQDEEGIHFLRLKRNNLSADVLLFAGILILISGAGLYPFNAIAGWILVGIGSLCLLISTLQK